MHANFQIVSSYFDPRLSPTLAKLHDGVSLLNNFLKLKFDHRFTCPFDKQESPPNFAMFRAIFIPLSPTLAKPGDEFHFWPTCWNLNSIIDLDSRLIDECARQLSQHFELFWPPLCLTLTKLHNIVSLLTNFSKLMFDHIFACSFHRKACTPTFEIFWAIWTIKPNHSENARRRFHFWAIS